MASGNMKDIKRRIKSVGGTMQITKAMELVASSKLRKAKQHASAARPFFETQYELMTSIAAENKELATVYNVVRPVKRRLFIVIAGDRGLAGGYNANLFSSVRSEEEKDGEKPLIIAIGKKAAEYFGKREYELVGSYPDVADNIKVADCSDMARTVTDLFSSGKADEVLIFYTMYVSPLVQTPTSLKLLPLEPTASSGAVQMTTYDPSPEAVFNRLVPKFILSIIHCSVVESYASEQSARRIAMQNASDNAETMISDLSLLYNRARQEKITNEINEIVGGANAL